MNELYSVQDTVKQISNSIVPLKVDSMLDMQCSSVISIIDSAINLFAEAQRKLAAILVSTPDPVVEDRMNRTSDYLATIAACFESDNTATLTNADLDTLAEHIDALNYELAYYVYRISGVKKIVVSGLTQLSVQLNRLLDPKKAAIITYLTEDPEKFGHRFITTPLLHPTQLEQIHYDYLITTDETMFPDSSNKIALSDFINTHYDFEIQRAYQEYSATTQPIDGFITGLSYAEVGIQPAELTHSVFNAALSSQDLYYDLQWARTIINNPTVGSNLKFAIISLGSYSFQYDLSKSSLKHRCAMYYPLFQALHHHPDAANIAERYAQFDRAASELFISNYINMLYPMLKHQGEAWWDNYISRILTPETVHSTLHLAEQDGNKNYPLTVPENIVILEEYITLLQSHNIVPIVLICPVSKHYYSRFSSRIQAEIEEILELTRQKFNIHVLNYFKSDMFSDDEFYDVSHLNKKGAKKLTALLNEQLNNWF